jgi:hypothetical protein
MTFIVFNGTGQPRNAQLVFPCCGSSATIAAPQSPDAQGFISVCSRYLQLDLAQNAVIYVRVSDELE